MINNLSIFENKKVLVTGSTGFKGSWLCIWLDLLGADVHGFSLKPLTKSDNFVVSNLEKKINQKYGNINNYDEISSYIKEIEPEIIFHLAAQPIVKKAYFEPLETIYSNINGTAHILEASKNQKSLKAIVNVTSDKCYLNNDEDKPFKEQDPLGGKDIYSASKACAEIINFAYQNSFFRNTQCAISSVRAGNVIGGGDWQEDRIVPDLVRSYQENKPLKIRMPNAIRPWQHVLEPIYGYLLLTQKMLENPTVFSGPWNFGPSHNQNISVNELIKMLALKFDGISIEVENSDVFETTYLRLSSEKAQNLLGWKNVLNENEMIDFIAEWYINFREKSPYNICVNQIKHFEQKIELRKI